ncbi:hypothetical protein E2C01_041487 [Portunus trituberculatus]|uniref:Uncharacterized protein n=1 Tax=Portunus trituberculatus TaxID=210409 RepID=A0A5B7FK44_PORTR|nr:hypothetical protein [Portunus trituberculatus]
MGVLSHLQRLKVARHPHLFPHQCLTRDIHLRGETEPWRRRPYHRSRAELDGYEPGLCAALQMRIKAADYSLTRFDMKTTPQHSRSPRMPHEVHM